MSLMPFHDHAGVLDKRAALQALGLEWLLQRQDEAATRAGLAIWTFEQIQYYQTARSVYPPNFIIVKASGDWWFFSGGVNDFPNIGGSIVGGIGEPWSFGVLVHAFFQQAYLIFIKPILDQLVGIPTSGTKFHFAGHSYGGALAFRAAVDYAARFGNDRVEVLTFGQPRLFTAGFPSPGFPFSRIAFALDPVPQLPPVTTGLSFQNIIGNATPVNIWTHYGHGLGLNLNGSMYEFPNIITQINPINLAVYVSSGAFHNYDLYFQAMQNAAGFSNLQSAEWSAFFNLLAAAQGPPVDELPVIPHPPANTIYDANKVNQVYFNGQPTVSQSQPFNFIVLDTVFDPTQLISVRETSEFISGGSDVMGLYQTEIHYAAFGDSWKERYCCEASGTAQALKFNTGNVAPLLAFRPPGTVITHMKASLIANPRLGDIKHINVSFGTPTTANRRGVTNDCALVEMRFGGIKKAMRSYRGIQDGIISYKADGTPDNTALIQGFLDTMEAALQNSPQWNSLGWILKTNSPPNFTQILSVIWIDSLTVNLQIDPAKIALFTAPGVTQCIIQGRKNRSLPGLSGRFAILGTTSPWITVRYSVINTQAPILGPGLTIRPYGANPVPFDKILFADWRAHKTADPIAQERGRGRAALTRT